MNTLAAQTTVQPQTSQAASCAHRPEHSVHCTGNFVYYGIVAIIWHSSVLNGIVEQNAVYSVKSAALSESIENTQNIKSPGMMGFQCTPSFVHFLRTKELF